MKNAKQILIDAREILETKGWCRGEFEKKDGKCCAIGAVLKASDLPTTVYPSYMSFEMRSAVAELAKFIKNSSFSSDDGKVESYNDKSHRRKKDVIRLFDRAIASIA